MTSVQTTVQKTNNINVLKAIRIEAENVVKIRESCVRLFRFSTPFRLGLRSPSSSNAKPLKMGAIYCVEISVTTYEPGPRKYLRRMPTPEQNSNKPRC